MCVHENVGVVRACVRMCVCMRVHVSVCVCVCVCVWGVCVWVSGCVRACECECVVWPAHGLTNTLTHVICM